MRTIDYSVNRTAWLKCTVEKKKNLMKNINKSKNNIIMFIRKIIVLNKAEIIE